MIETMLKGYDLLLLPRGLKEVILKEIEEGKKLSPFKMMSKEEFQKRITYDYDEETIFYVMKHYCVKREVAENYIQNTYYVEEKEYPFEKLNFLVHLKKELQEENLLKMDPVFQNYVNTHKVAILGYDDMSLYEEELCQSYSVEKIELSNKNVEKKISYYPFSTLEEEVIFLADEISALLDNGVPLSDIKITNVGSEYFHKIKEIFSFYHIPIYGIVKDSIYGTPLCHFILKNLNLSKEELLAKVKETFDFGNEENKKLLKSVISILNHYTFQENLEEVKELIEEDFQNTRKEEVQFGVEVVPFLNTVFKETDHVFFLGANQGSFPKIYKDEDFIPDEMKNGLSLLKTVDKNKKAYEIAKRKIRTIPNLVMSSKLKSTFDTYLPSSLLEELPIEISKKSFRNIRYSILNDHLTLASMLDEYKKYGKKEEYLETYFENYPEIPYDTYDNRFTGIKKEQLEKRMKGQLRLSYTSLDTYKRCAFRYYVSRILKCDPFDETFSIFIGNLFHNILKRAFKKNFDFEECFHDFVMEREYSYKERFFLNCLKEELKFDIEVIKKQEEEIGLKEVLREEEIEIPLSADMPSTFYGIVDKIFYQEENDKTLASIIDYKTGALHTDLNSVIYGIHMQLPIYFYLLKRYPKLENVEVVGFYLQKILNSEENIKKGVSREEVRKKNLRLTGFSTSNMDKLKQFDPNYEDSDLIKGLKVGQNGFYATAKVLNAEELETLDKVVEEQIASGVQNILSGNFEINPKVIGKKEVGCESCPYFDLCYKKEEDKVYLEEQKTKEFLEE